MIKRILFLVSTTYFTGCSPANITQDSTLKAKAQQLEVNAADLECDSFVEPGDTITSPGYPSNYENDTDQVVCVSSDSMFSLVWEYFSTEREYDYILVFDENGEEIFYATGSIADDERHLQNLRGMIKIYFHSDYSVTRKGYSLSVSGEEQSVESLIPDELDIRNCDRLFVLENDSFEEEAVSIRNYSVYHRRKWCFVAQSTTDLVSISWTSFQLGSDDTIQIRAHNDNLSMTLSGDGYLPPKLSSKAWIVLDLQSGSHHRSTDHFSLSYTIEDGLTPDEVVPDVCGDGIRGITEECDGDQLQGLSCIGWGYSQGEMVCSDDCQTIDTSDCSGYLGGSGGGDGNNNGDDGDEDNDDGPSCSNGICCNSTSDCSAGYTCHDMRYDSDFEAGDNVRDCVYVGGFSRSECEEVYGSSVNCQASSCFSIAHCGVGEICARQGSELPVVYACE